METPRKERKVLTRRAETRNTVSSSGARHSEPERHRRQAFGWFVPAILVVCLVGGTVAAIAGVGGVVLPILGFFLGVFILPVAGIIRFLRWREHQDRRERAEFGQRQGHLRGRRARFSNGPYAKWLPIGIAVVAAAIAYPIANEFFTHGRYRFAAIFLVVLAPLVAILVLYDPLARALDVYLARRQESAAERGGSGDRER
jgi:hypothetical protein